MATFPIPPDAYDADDESRFRRQLEQELEQLPAGAEGGGADSFTALAAEAEDGDLIQLVDGDWAFVTPDPGLTNLGGFPVASEAEAQEGTADDRIMTPERTAGLLTESAVLRVGEDVGVGVSELTLSGFLPADEELGAYRVQALLIPSATAVFGDPDFEIGLALPPYGSNAGSINWGWRSREWGDDWGSEQTGTTWDMVPSVVLDRIQDYNTSGISTFQEFLPIYLDSTIFVRTAQSAADDATQVRFLQWYGRILSGTREAAAAKEIEFRYTRGNVGALNSLRLLATSPSFGTPTPEFRGGWLRATRLNA